MEVHRCIKNCERPLFITLEENDVWQTQESSPRVDPDLENRILSEYINAKFEYINEDLYIAETQNFIFRKNTKKYDKKIVWVEAVDLSLISTYFQ